MTEYCEFEHKVLELIQKELRVISFGFEKDTTKAMQTKRGADGQFHDVVVAIFVKGEFIILNFTNNFRYKFNLNMELSIYVQSENTLNFQYHIFRFSKPEQI